MMVDCFFKELDKLYGKSIDERKNYLKFLFSQLHKIENRDETIEREEPIIYKGMQLYSIRKRMKKNTRVLYYCMKNGKILLLTAFDEKGDSDYERGKERSYNRLKELKQL